MYRYSTFPIGINVFVIKEGKLLLGRRKGGYGEGEWGLPGGHLETGENMIDAARRELVEETSLKANKFSFVNLVNDPNTFKHYIQVGFLAEEVGGDVTLLEPDKCSGWEWFPLDALPEVIFSGHRKQIELFKDKMLFGEESSV